MGSAGGGAWAVPARAPWHDPAPARAALRLDGDAGPDARPPTVVPGLVATGAVVSDARSTILARIQAALGDVPAGEDPSSAAVERQYRRTHETSPEQLVDSFAERV